MSVMQLLRSSLRRSFPLRGSRGIVSHQRESSTTVSAVFVDEVGRRRRCMVVMGRTAVALLMMATASVVIALASGARMSLPLLRDVIAAPAERLIEGLSDLPPTVLKPPAAGRVSQRAPVTPATPSVSTSEAPGADNPAAADSPVPARVDVAGEPVPTKRGVSADGTGVTHGNPAAAASQATRPDIHPASPAPGSHAAPGSHPPRGSHPAQPHPTGTAPGPPPRPKPTSSQAKHPKPAANGFVPGHVRSVCLDR